MRAFSSPSQRFLRLIANLVLVAIGLLFLIPLLWVLLASFDSSNTLSVEIPKVFTLSNFAAILNPQVAFTPLLNSLYLAGGSAILAVVVSILAAYPLSRYRLRITQPYLYVILFGTSLPITAMMVPVYSLFVQLNLIDSLTGTMLFMATSTLPISIWMMKNFMDSVPISLEEAAWVDGASAMGTLWRIVVPLMRPGIAVVFIYIFIQAWGNFFVPFILLLSPQNEPAAVSIFNFFGSNGSVAYGQLAAYSLIYSVPVLALYVLIQRGLGGSSALAGAVKG